MKLLNLIIFCAFSVSVTAKAGGGGGGGGNGGSGGGSGGSGGGSGSEGNNGGGSGGGGGSSSGSQYSFKCSTTIFMCGGLQRDQVCNNPGTGAYISATPAECAGMIAATKTSSTYTFKCPNNRAISHYVKYDACLKTTGLKTGGDKTEQCQCPSGQCGRKEGCGVTGGDPHFRTHDGTMYSYHGECDLVIARSPTFGSGIGLDVHGRTEIVTGWSLISNAAIRIGEDVFEVTNNGDHYFNGATDISLPIFMAGDYKVSKKEESVDVKGMVGKKAVRTWYTVDLKNGESIVVSVWKNMIGVNVKAKLADTEGMLGNSKKAGLVGRDGSTVLTDFNEMGAQWQVQDTEAMLFHETRSPQYPERCILPRMTSRRLRQSEDAYGRAQDACSDVDDEALRNFCVEDVLLTGDIAAAHTYGAVF